MTVERDLLTLRPQLLFMCRIKACLTPADATALWDMIRSKGLERTVDTYELATLSGASAPPDQSGSLPSIGDGTLPAIPPPARGPDWSGRLTRARTVLCSPLMRGALRLAGVAHPGLLTLSRAVEMMCNASAAGADAQMPALDGALCTAARTLPAVGVLANPALAVAVGVARAYCEQR